MKVFISWSGEGSKKLAESLRKWLPAVLQLVKPYFTPSDIEKGTRWNTEITKELESSVVGILCVTRDNLHSDWIMFEAGALSKSLDKAHVCPVLFGIQNADLAGPLRQFQTTEFEKEEIRKLVSVINTKLGDDKLETTVFNSVFEKWWPELEVEVNTILHDIGDGSSEPIRSDRELLVEILELSRTTAQTIPTPSSPYNWRAIRDLLGGYIAVHDQNVAGRGGYQDTLNNLEEMRKAISYIVDKTPDHPQINELKEKLDKLSFIFEKEKSSTVEDDDLPF